jgi:hypothetical protein
MMSPLHRFLFISCSHSAHAHRRVDSNAHGTHRYEETPWEAMRYLISGVMYGGHVTDDNDRRLMMTYINELFCPEALTVGYRFSDADEYVFCQCLLFLHVGVRVASISHCCGQDHIALAGLRASEII